jgi:hypothetical protein
MTNFSDLTQEQKNVLIAEALFAARIEPPTDGFPYWSLWYGEERRHHWDMRDVDHKVPTFEDVERWRYIENFYKNRTALHEAILKLDDEQTERFCRHLWGLANNEDVGPNDEIYIDCAGMVGFVRASTPQLADAVVMVLLEKGKV